MGSPIENHGSTRSADNLQLQEVEKSFSLSLDGEALLIDDQFILKYQGRLRKAGKKRGQIDGQLCIIVDNDQSVMPTGRYGAIPHVAYRQKKSEDECDIAFTRPTEESRSIFIGAYKLSFQKKIQDLSIRIEPPSQNMSQVWVSKYETVEQLSKNFATKQARTITGDIG